MKSWIIIKNNIKKSKATCFILLLLVCLATMLIITATNALGIITRNVGDMQKESCSADLFTAMPQAYSEQVEGTLTSMDGVDFYEKENVIYFGGSSISNITQEKPSQDIPIMLGNMDRVREISKLDMISISTEKHDNGVYLPYYMNVTEGYRLGDIVRIKNTGVNYDFVVDGFYQDINFASPSNVSIYYIFVNGAEQEKNVAGVAPSNIFSAYWVAGDGTVEPNDLEVNFSDVLSEKYGLTTKDAVAYNIDSMKTGATMYAQILMMVLLGFAVILIIITIVVIRFAILTYIEQNYKNLGVMEAAGYTSWNLLYTLVAQFSLIALVGSVLGMAAALFGSGIITRLIDVASGLHCPISYSLVTVIIEMISSVLIIAVITALLSLKIRKLSVLKALRDGINTHNFKKNYVPLDKTHLHLNTAIGLKNLFIERKQNISIGIIVGILCFSIVLSFTMYSNFTGDSNNDVLWDFIGTDRSDVMNMYSDEEKAEKISQMDEVEICRYACFMSGKISSSEGSSLANVKVSDDYSTFSTGVILEGRFPKHENEASITIKIAELLNVGIDDTIIMSTETGEEEFLVVGITQQLNSLGKGACITLEGACRIIPDFEVTSQLLVLKEGVNTQEFMDKVYAELGQDGIELVNYKKIMHDVMTSYESSMGMLSIGACAITVVVIGLVLFLLVNIKILRDRKKNGVFKALGYTTPQLMQQIVISFVPSIIIGCIAGILLGIFGCNPIIALMLSGSGIKRCTFIVPVDMVLIAAAVLLVISVLIAVLSSLKIRKITPEQLLVEE